MISNELLGVDNLCGQNLQRLVSRGSAIIAELLRLSDNTPEVFWGVERVRDPAQLKYLSVLFDFHYLRDPEEYEKKINADMDMLDLDQEFQENHDEILNRFYRLFESIWKFQADVGKFIDDVNNGFYIQHSIESILDEVDGKQLLCEALYLYGTMLLLLEDKIPGPVREKILIAIYRYNIDGRLVNIDEVCKLCRATGYVPGPQGKKPKNHPCSLFARFPPNPEFVRLLIGRMQTDDIYLMANSFPNPDHRSTRLSGQAAMLYVILFFVPDILTHKKATMREIVDKYFNDNWVISKYMGQLVDLTLEWANYPAAKTALEGVINAQLIKDATDKNTLAIQKSLDELKLYLTEGVLTQDYLLDNVNTLINAVRNCNISLRWRLLHRRCVSDSYRKYIQDTVSPQVLMTLLLNTSQFEYILKDMLQALLDEKEVAWTDGKNSAAERMIELSEYFTGEKALTRVKKDENLMRWFKGLADQVNSLNLNEDHATSTGRKIQGLINALEDVEQFEVVDTNLQIKSFLNEARDIFRQMVRTVNVKTEIMHVLENITDFSYAWDSLPDYLSVFHDRIRRDPTSVVLLRATFLKAASILDVPLVRITAIDSPDAESVAEYYSGLLVDFVRLVLEVIPVSVFRILSTIETIQTHHLKTIPSRLEAKDLRDYAQLDYRVELAKQTHQVSIFTEGVLVMEKTLLGVIQVEPRQILEEGLRRELVRLVSSAMDSDLTFPEMTRQEINQKMSKLGATLEGLKHSIEYLQDYIDIAGLKIFQQEISRIINYSIEQESNRFVKRKIFDANSRYQNKAIPIPRFSSRPQPTIYDRKGKKRETPYTAEGNAINFMGRVMYSLLYLTDCSQTVYAPECSAWFSHPSPEEKVKKGEIEETEEVCGVRTFAILEKAIGAIGLRGLDRLFAFRNVNLLNSFIKFYINEVHSYRVLLDQVRDELHPEYKLLPPGSKLYMNATKKLEKLLPQLLTFICMLGQAQLIRRQIAHLLRFNCQMDAHLLYQALDTFNTGVVNDIRRHYNNPTQYSYPSKENPILPELTKLLESCGMDDPLSKIYVTSHPLEGLPVLLLMLLVQNLPKLKYDENFGALIRRKDSYGFDGFPLAVGLACLLRQYHPSMTRKLIGYLGQYVRSTIHSIFGANEIDTKAVEMPVEVLNTLIFLNHLCHYTSVPRSVVYSYIPPFIFDSIRF